MRRVLCVVTLPDFQCGLKKFCVLMLVQIVDVVETWIFQPQSKYVQSALNEMNRPSVVSESGFDHLVPMLRSLSEHQVFWRLFRLSVRSTGRLTVSSCADVGTFKKMTTETHSRGRAIPPDTSRFRQY